MPGAEDLEQATIKGERAYDAMQSAASQQRVEAVKA
jgi:hypothetical protein